MSRAPIEEVIVHSPWKEEAPRQRRNKYGVALMIQDKEEEEKVRVKRTREGLGVTFDWQGIVFGGVYLPPSWTVDECVEELKAIIRTAKEAPLVIFGDWNMRLGSRTGDRLVTERGRHLGEWLEEEGLALLPGEPGIATFTELAGEGWSIVDLFFGNEEARKLWRGTRVLEEEDMGGSDHRMIIGEFALPQRGRPERAEVCTHKAWNLGKLEDERTRIGYERTLRAKLEPWFEDWDGGRALEGTDIDRMEEGLCQAIEEAARTTIGERTKRKRRDGTGIVESEALRGIRRQRRALYQRLGCCRPEDKARLREEYRACLKEQRVEVKRELERRFAEFSAKVSSKSKSEQSKILSNMRKQRSRGTGAGRMLDNDPDSMDRYRAHFAGQFSRKEFQAPSPIRVDLEGLPADRERQPFTNEETYQGILRSTNGKAPGASGIRVELLKAGGLTAASALAVLFNACWRTGRCPKRWKQALVHPVPKKGDLTRIENYRPISLTEVMRKIFEGVLWRTKLGRVVEPLDMTQGGFRARRSTVDQAAALHEAITQSRKTLGRAPVLAFLDIKAAYDTVDRTKLWPKLAQKGSSRQLMAMLMELFDQNTARVVVGGRQSKEVRMEMGLMQGSILSPALYATFIDDIGKRCRAKARMTMGKTRVGAFLYADDIALIGETGEQVQRLLRECESHSYELGYRFAPNKCEAIGSGELELYGERLGESRQFKYLGFPVEETGINFETLGQRGLEKLRAATNMFRQLGFNDRGFDLECRRQLARTFLRPCIEYGLGITPGRKKYLDPLQRGMNGVVRAMLSMGRGTSNERMRFLAGLQTVGERREELRAKWLLHAQSAPEGFMLREAYEAHGRRKVRGSVFAEEARNELLRRVRKKTLLGGGKTRARDQRTELRAAIKARREEEEQRVRRDERVRQTMAAASWELRRDLTAMEPGARRATLRWMMGRPAGKPRKCLRCEASTSARHMQECTKTDLDGLCRHRQWDQFHTALAMVLEGCTGRAWNPP